MVKMKKFLILGNPNAITYIDLFLHLKNREVFVNSANDTISFTMFFITDSGEIKSTSSIWFSTLNRDSYTDLKLDKKYDADKYNHLLNYDAINVDKVKDIPYDYDGIMAVPITVMFYNPQQFYIIGSGNANVLPSGWKKMTKEFIDLYHSQGGTGQYQVGNRLEFYINKDGKAKIPYKRILIKLKKNE